MKISSLPQRFYTALVTSACFVIVYNFTNWVSSQRTDIGVAAFAWEAYIPFIPIFIIPYWSIDLFFIAAPFFLTKQEDLTAYRRRIVLAIALAGAFFLLFPLELQFKRPVVPGVVGVLFSSLENLNNFWNLAPSLHIALRTILWTVYIPLCRGLTQGVLRLWFIFVGLSTLLCWQHHVIDVFTGQLLALFVIQFIPAASSSVRVAPTNRHVQLARRYLAGAIVWLLLCVMLWPVGFLLLWPSVSFLLVALAYWRNDPAILGKVSGQLTSAAWWTYLPYRALARAWQSKYLSQELAISRVSEELSFGAMPDCQQASRLAAPGILDLTAEYSEAASLLSKHYRNVPLLDLVCPNCHQLKAAVEAIEELKQFGEVYLHCALGLGRSAMVSAAWLLFTAKSSSPEAAVAEVISCSPGAKLGATELAMLNKFFKEINEHQLITG